MKAALAREAPESEPDPDEDEAEAEADSERRRGRVAAADFLEFLFFLSFLVAARRARRADSRIVSLRPGNSDSSCNGLDQIQVVHTAQAATHRFGALL